MEKKHIDGHQVGPTLTKVEGGAYEHARGVAVVGGAVVV